MTTSIFTLEALNAAHGDCLLLHYGTRESPRLILIDGGAGNSYEERLKPRLEQLRKIRGGHSLEVRLMMLSHIDDDHIRGLLDLTEALRLEHEAGKNPSVDILSLWHNSFDEILKPLGADAAASIAHALRARRGESTDVAASVPQGRTLRLNADALSVNINPGFDQWVHFPQRAIDLGQGLSLTVLGPRETELKRLQQAWNKAKKRATSSKPDAQAGTTLGSDTALGGRALSLVPLDVTTADYMDKSVTNLSSIVVLAKLGNQSMLLTGDARGDLILKSVSEAKLLKRGVLKVDVLKVPHHGSSRDVSQKFFNAIQADHYVFSANGKYDNPDDATFKMLFAARPKGSYKIWLTNPVAAAVKFIEQNKPSGVKLVVRSDGDLSVRVELATPIAQ